MIEPAVKGTTNVLEACLKANVERVVFVSSIAAVCINPNVPKDKVIDESFWSDKDYCKETKVSEILLHLCYVSFLVDYTVFFISYNCRICYDLIIVE